MSNDGFIIVRSDDAKSLTLTHNGECNHAVLEAFTGFVMNETEGVLEPKEVKTILFVSNELIQNVGFYSIDRNSEERTSGKGTFELIITPDRVTMNSTNRSTPEVFARLKEKITALNLLSEEELKAHYKEKLRQQSDEHSKGGGIGLIEIRRKTKQNIEVQLKTENENYFITFHATMKRGTENG